MQGDFEVRLLVKARGRERSRSWRCKEISRRLRRERERSRDDEEILRRLDYSTKLGREKLVAMLGYFVLGVSFAGGFCGSGFRRWVFGSGFWRWLFKSGFYLLFGMLLLFTIF